MATINYNSSNIEKIILPNLLDSVLSLKNACSICSQLNIPYDFEYRTQLKLLSQELESKYGKLNDIYSRIKISSSMFNSSETQLQNSINNINNPKFSLRKSIIR